MRTDPISVEEALRRVLAEAERLPEQRVGLRHGLGRVLARAIAAPRDSPPFDTSAMDGFALRAEDVAGARGASPVELEILEEVAAGDGRERRLSPGHTVRINTGAPLPIGADGVAPIERVEVAGGRARLREPVAPGQHIRRAGEDYPAGKRLLEPGTRLDPRGLAVVASVGMAEIPVRRRPRVCLMATGNELAEPGERLAAGQIYNSSRFALEPMLAAWGAEAHVEPVVADAPETTREALERGLTFDVLVTTGGVSMGSRDLVRPGLLELGAREIFWKVRQRPGQPLFFARRGGTLCFGLPGNPVSVFVTAVVYVRAALLKMQGAAEVELPWSVAVVGAPIDKQVNITSFVRVKQDCITEAGLPQIAPMMDQGSHQAFALAKASGLARLDEASAGAAPGERVPYLDFGRFFGLP